ncbi:MAG: hypothetical protein Q9190_001615 [Brigantiaea leucoxantha]
MFQPPPKSHQFRQAHIKSNQEVGKSFTKARENYDAAAGQSPTSLEFFLEAELRRQKAAQQRTSDWLKKVGPIQSHEASIIGIQKSESESEKGEIEHRERKQDPAGMQIPEEGKREQGGLEEGNNQIVWSASQVDPEKEAMIIREIEAVIGLGIWSPSPLPHTPTASPTPSSGSQGNRATAVESPPRNFSMVETEMLNPPPSLATEVFSPVPGSEDTPPMPPLPMSLKKSIDRKSIPSQTTLSISHEASTSSFYTSPSQPPPPPPSASSYHPPRFSLYPPRQDSLPAFYHFPKVTTLGTKALVSPPFPPDAVTTSDDSGEPRPRRKSSRTNIDSTVDKWIEAMKQGLSPPPNSSSPYPLQSTKDGRLMEKSNGEGKGKGRRKSQRKGSLRSLRALFGRE